MVAVAHSEKSRTQLPRKAQKPLCLFVRLYGEDREAILAITKGRRGAHNAIAYAGTMAEVRRIQSTAAEHVSPAVAKAVAEFKQITGDTDASLVETLALVAKAKLAADTIGTGPVHHRKD